MISFDLPATASWPSTSRCRLAHRPLADPTAEQPAPAAPEGGDQMQRRASLGPRMAAPRGLAVDGDDVRLGLAQLRHPGHEAGFEQSRVEGVDDVAQRVVAGNTVLVGQEPA